MAHASKFARSPRRSYITLMTQTLTETRPKGTAITRTTARIEAAVASRSPRTRARQSRDSTPAVKTQRHSGERRQRRSAAKTSRPGLSAVSSPDGARDERLILLIEARGPAEVALNKADELVLFKYTSRLADLLKMRKSFLRIGIDVSARNCSEKALTAWAGVAGVSEPELKIAIDRGVRCRNILVERNMMLVISIVRKFSKSSAPHFSDLVQAGVIGLIRGIEGYDAARGFCFSTYVTYWIQAKVFETINRQSRTIYIPPYASKYVQQYRKIHDKLSANPRGPQPNIQHIAEIMDCPTQKLEHLVEVSGECLSLDAHVDADDSDRPRSIGSTLRGEDSHAFEHMVFCDALTSIMASALTPRQYEVICYRFGIGGKFEPVSLRAAGVALGISSERVRQIERSALQTLRNNAALAELRDTLV